MLLSLSEELMCAWVVFFCFCHLSISAKHHHIHLKEVPQFQSVLMNRIQLLMD